MAQDDLDQDELLRFADPEPHEAGRAGDVLPQVWRVLVVDDDQDVHESTSYALRGLTLEGRGLELIHANSGAQAIEILRHARDVAVILLDVVMESEQSGLATVRAIRHELGLNQVRIILRTGQPGQAPEIDTIRRFDINDYKTKSELTRTKLYATLTTAIRAYAQLQRLEASRRGLEQVVAASNQLMAEQGLQAFAEGVITQVAGLLGVAPDGLVCAGSGAPGGSAHYQVIAAAGQCARLMHQRIDEIDDPHLMASLSRCLGERRHVINERSVTLFFPGREGGDFAAYVAASTPLQQVDSHLLEVLCTNLALCADNIELVTRLRDFAFIDRMLGLPNRTAFIKRLDEVIQSGAHAGKVVALMDVDQFAETNDMFGHVYGDLLLSAIAQRLGALDLGDGMLARVGGDSFAIFGSETLVNPAALRSVVGLPFEIDGVQRPVSISMGLVACDRNDARGGLELLKDASIALKRAKEGGQSRSEYYSAEMRVVTRERTRLLHGLHQAYDHERLFVVYQPQVNMKTGRAVGVEALLRWRADDGTFVPPDQFIPVAEKSGLIVAIGAWTLRTALYGLAQLHRLGYPHLRLAVNVSSVQLAQSRFAHVVDEALRDTRVAPEKLELEITESVAVMGLERAAILMEQFTARGILLAIDDFGTGFSSLSYLDRLPVDRIKIDRAFVAALDSGRTGARIAEMIVPLGHQLGMQVIAEGVENEAQANMLRALNCDEAQGFLYAKPMPMDQLITWLKQHEKETTP